MKTDKRNTTKTAKRGCVTCKWAKFAMRGTKSRRIDTRHAGECTWPLPPVPPMAQSHV